MDSAVLLMSFSGCDGAYQLFSWRFSGADNARLVLLNVVLWNVTYLNYVWFA